MASAFFFGPESAWRFRLAHRLRRLWHVGLAWHEIGDSVLGVEHLDAGGMSFLMQQKPANNITMC